MFQTYVIIFFTYIYSLCMMLSILIAPYQRINVDMIEEIIEQFHEWHITVFVSDFMFYIHCTEILRLFLLPVN